MFGVLTATFLSISTLALSVLSSIVFCWVLISSVLFYSVLFSSSISSSVLFFSIVFSFILDSSTFLSWDLLLSVLVSFYRFWDFLNFGDSSSLTSTFLKSPSSSMFGTESPIELDYFYEFSLYRIEAYISDADLYFLE